MAIEMTALSFGRHFPLSSSTEPLWLPVVGYEGLYEVSDDGRVRSLHNRTLGLALPPFLDEDGYPRVHLNREGRRRNRRIHRLVAEAFHARHRNILHNEVAHLDGSRTNACASNLKWVSKAENNSHKRLH